MAEPPFLAWLKDAATHGLAADAAVDVLETPACWVVLAGERAIKVKKPVNLGFLDFSTLEKRRETMCEELRLNRRTAPDYYLRVADITRDEAGRFAFDGAGEAVEVALIMKRFPQERLLSRIAEGQGVSDEIAEALGVAIAAFHGSESPADEPGLQAMERHARINAGALEETAAAFGPGDVDLAVAATTAAIAAHQDLIAARGRNGFVRHLHGDLHLENIFLDERDRPTPFDALEFDAKLATTDVMLDLAFALMDLVERRQRRAASRTLNVWLDHMARAEAGGQHERLGEACADGLALLPLCMALRAQTRAHVRARLALSLRGAERRRRTDEARSYLAHAIAWLDPAPSRLIAVGGRSGSGKSTLAKALAPEVGGPIGAVVIRTDEVRKRLAGVAPHERLPKSAYAPERHAQVYAAAISLAERTLAAGVSVILDAAFLAPFERDAARAAASAWNVPFTGLWLEAPDEMLVARVAARGADASDADAAVVRSQIERDVGAIDWEIVDASGAFDATLARACALAASAGPDRCH